MPLVLMGGIALAASVEGQSTPEPDELVVDGRVVGQRVEVRPGDICLICKERVSPGDLAYLVRRQRAALHRDECEPDFLAWSAST